MLPTATAGSGPAQDIIGMSTDCNAKKLAQYRAGPTSWVAMMIASACDPTQLADSTSEAG